MRILLFILATLAAFPQAQTPLRIIQSSGSLSGELWQQEPRSGGQNYFKAKIPILATDVSLTYPNALPATNGECWTATTAGISSWQPCAAANAIVNNGNTFGTVVSIGTNDAFALRFEVQNVAAWEIATTGEFFPLFNNSLDIGKSATTIRTLYAGTSLITPKIGRDTSASLTLMTDSFDRWIVNSAGMLYPATDDTYDFGLTGTRARGVYAKFGEFYKSGSTSSSDYVTSRKFNFMDQAGGSGSWDLHASGSMAATSKIMLRDNAGSRWLEGWRALAGSPLNYTSVFGNLYPAKRLIASGDAVDDSVFGDLGATGSRWATGYLGTTNTNTLVVNNTVTSTLNPSPTNTHQLGDATLRWSQLYSVLGNFSGVLTTDEIRPDTGSTRSIGQTGNRYLRGFFDGITTGGTTFYENGSSLILRPTNTFTIDACATPGEVLTAGASGLMACAAAGGVTAPLTLTLGAAGYSVPLVVQNNTVGLNGSCIEVAGHDSGSTVYSLGRLCAKFDSALFTDELVSLMTVTGSGTWQTAQSWKNLDSSFYGNVIFATASSTNIGQTGSRALRVFTDGITTGGSTFFENGSSLTLRSTNTFTIDSCTTVGQVLTAGASGVMGCAAAAPFIDSTAIIKGSTDASKLLAIEVDGFTTATTRTLTPQNASYTIAGTNIAQTFSGANTFSVGQAFSAGFSVDNNITFTTASAVNIGATGSRALRVFTDGITTGGSTFVQSGATWNFQAGAAVNYNGNAGQSVTVTVRDAAGTGTCTLIFDFGGKTGGTC